MKIKRTVSTFIQKQYTNSREYSIRTSVRWKKEKANKNEFVAFNVGCTILPEKWNAANGIVKKNCINRKMISSVEINNKIQHLANAIENVFKKFEVENHTPTKTEFRDNVNIALGKNPGKKSEMTLVQDAFGIYIRFIK